MNKQAFLQGFMEKCSAYNFTLKQANSLLKKAMEMSPEVMTALAGGGVGAGLGGVVGSQIGEGDLMNILGGASAGGISGAGIGYAGSDKIMSLIDKIMPGASVEEKVQIVKSIPPEVVAKIEDVGTAPAEPEVREFSSRTQDKYDYLEQAKADLAARQGYKDPKKTMDLDLMMQQVGKGLNFP